MFKALGFIFALFITAPAFAQAVAIPEVTGTPRVGAVDRIYGYWWIIVPGYGEGTTLFEKQPSGVWYGVACANIQGSMLAQSDIDAAGGALALLKRDFITPDAACIKRYLDGFSFMATPQTMMNNALRTSCGFNGQNILVCQ